MGRGDYTTTEKGDEYFEKGQNLYREGKHELAMDWLKKALFVFQFQKNKEKFIEVLNRMADMLRGMGLSSQSLDVQNLVMEYKNMEQDEFERECQSIKFKDYVERPTFFNTKESVLLCDLLHDLKSMASA